jgi:metal-responsive CopG/Arc/MetJ family transcriptional regulator
MPSSLIDELKDISIKNHYMDVSEAMRSLLRERWLEEKSPAQAKISELKKSVSKITDEEKIKAMKKTLKLLEELNEL